MKILWHLNDSKNEGICFFNNQYCYFSDNIIYKLVGNQYDYEEYWKDKIGSDEHIKHYRKFDYTGNEIIKGT